MRRVLHPQNPRRDLSCCTARKCCCRGCKVSSIRRCLGSSFYIVTGSGQAAFQLEDCSFESSHHRANFPICSPLSAPTRFLKMYIVASLIKEVNDEDEERDKRDRFSLSIFRLTVWYLATELSSIERHWL